MPVDPSPSPSSSDRRPSEGGAGPGRDPYVDPPAGAQKSYEARPDRETWRPDAATGDEAASSANPAASTNGRHHSPAQSLKDLGTLLGELKEYASYFVSTKVTGFKASLRNLAIYAALGILGLIVGSGLLIAAAVYLLHGMAHGLGDLLWDKWWLGELIVGLLVLGGTAVVVILGLKRVTSSARKQLVDQYEERQRAQRVTFGHDVEDRAIEQRAIREHDAARRAQEHQHESAGK